MYEVEPSQIARPDLLSYDLYGDELYADILCKLNGISNPLELNEGMIIIIPSPDDLDKFVINSPNSTTVSPRGRGRPDLTPQANTPRGLLMTR